ncbi:hypothetical protein Tco_1072577, partial [Tanacetum coccineum]
MKIVHEDSWSDSNVDDHEEANEVYLIAVGSQKITTLAEYIIAAGAENCPPMLKKSMYDSWASHDCDVQATYIILHGLPPDVYALVNHQEAAKDIWDRVKLLMKG